MSAHYGGDERVALPYLRDMQRTLIKHQLTHRCGTGRMKFIKITVEDKCGDEVDAYVLNTSVRHC